MSTTVASTHRCRRAAAAKQEARNALFAAALVAPQHRDFPTHAAYLEAYTAYQASTMQPLRDKLASA